MVMLITPKKNVKKKENHEDANQLKSDCEKNVNVEPDFG